ncbi:MAG: RNA-binding S4 domain-containing protein [Thiobacillus sp.]
MADKAALVTMRLDKWLWAARFYKTRSLAIEAINHGRVEVNAMRAKPAREIRLDDQVELRIGDSLWRLTVRGLSIQRGPAPVARTLYEEAADSQAARQAQDAARKLNVAPEAGIKGRPTKRDRRLIHRFTES